ncbi:hypothetical protein [Azospirillum sp. TSH64]|uniref:hypothetical protein n=1 Tax=Azospirillum sp. TSH64 TaxID=652740 RepID=UPI000D615A87|nr:hypothetical protein [Azospirillum sp. TSH64]PWC75062.1 hypothetical protein TSH64_08880 [Azospirillum sp. TSH64]
MEIRGVSSTTALRPTAFQPTEAGAASPSTPVQASGSGTSGEAEKSSGAGFISPFMRYDQGARVAVLYFRDFDTGETQDQIPSQRVVEEYRRTANRLSQEDERKAAAAKSGSDGSPGGAGTSSGSGYGAAASGFGSTGTTTGTAASPSIGVSFASAPGSSGTAAGSATAAPTTGGVTPAATGGYGGGSPGGLVSVTV